VSVHRENLLSVDTYRLMYERPDMVQHAATQTSVQHPMLTQPGNSGRVIGLATAGVVVYSLLVPLLGLYRFFVTPIDPGRSAIAVVAMACYLPLQAWLVFAATREVHRRAELSALAILAAWIIGMAPIVGAGWFGTFYVVGALVLVLVRAPWSLVLFALVLAAPVILAAALGHPEWGTYFSFGVALAGLPLAVVVLLIRSARQLRAAQRALAEEAVTRARLRMDRELQGSVGAALERIVDTGDRAAALISGGEPSATEQVQALTTTARSALADARRLLRRYQDNSFRAELDAAVGLLQAAAIAARLEVVGSLPDVVGDQVRTALREGVARVLAANAQGHAVTIRVAPSGGGVRVELVPDEAG